MDKVHFGIGGVERAGMNAAAGWTAHDDGRGRIPEVVALGHEIGDLVERAEDEVDELHLANGPQANVAHAAGSTDDGAFADGRVDNPLPAETFEQTLAGLECSAVDPHVFADEHDGGVALHLFEHGLLDGFEKGDRSNAGHGCVGWGGGRHAYLRAFRATAAATAALSGFFTTFLAGALGASFCSFSVFSCVAGVSPK